MPDIPETIHVVAIASDEELIPLVDEFASANDFTISSYDDLEKHEGESYIVCESQQEAEAALAALERALPDWQWMFNGHPLTMEVRTLRRENWAESWKKHFHTFRASERLVIKPSWEDYQPAQGDILINLDPGMCFGTGYHGTTKACLQFMDDINRKHGAMSFIDAGCGSGVLSMAARKLGYSPVLGFDNDPQCITTTLENMRLAGIDGIALETADVFTFHPQPARLVVVNILATILLQTAENIVSFIDASKGDGFLVLSGILTEQYQSVLERFTALGLCETQRKTINEWTSGLFILR